MVIDVSQHRDATGKLYMPSYPWGVDMRREGMEPTTGGPLASTSAKTKQAAMERAQLWCSKIGDSAQVFRRKDGKVAIRYWRDAEGLQYIEY